MNYKELEEQINQQGTQCGVNLMGSAVLEVECTYPFDDNAFITENVIEAFRRDSDESIDDILLHMYDLSQSGKLPTIEAVYRNNEASSKIHKTKIAYTYFGHDAEGYPVAGMSWIFEGNVQFWEY